MRASSIFFFSTLALLAMNVACSGSNDSFAGGGPPSSLFDVPAGTATRDRLGGLWGGSFDQGSVHFDFRVRVDEGKTTVGSRCEWTDGTVLTVGAAAASRVEKKAPGDLSCFPLDPGGPASECGEVDFLESKSDRQGSGERWCAVNLQPKAYKYTLSGTKLQFDLDGAIVKMIKLTD